MTTTLRMDARPPAGQDLIGESDFAEIARLLHGMTGIELNPAKRAMVSARLSRLVQRLGLCSIAEYCALLREDRSAAVRAEFINTMTTNVTRFGREGHQFEHFEAWVLPGLVERLRRGGRVRIWSAGCSSGEEPCDLAIRVAEACPEAARLDFRILASDIDTAILDQARRGIYSGDGLEGLSPARLAAHFSRAPEGMKLSPGVRQMISYRQLNLQADWPFHGMFDVIMCRNVTIYFDAATQARLWQRFTSRLGEGGVLYIGHSETVTPDISRHYAGEGVSIFRRAAERATEETTSRTRGRS